MTVVAICIAALASPVGLVRPALAQRDSTARTGVTPVLEAVGAIGVAAVLDRPARASLRARGPDGPITSALVHTGDVLGTARHVVPALAGAYVVTRIVHPHTATDVLDAAAGYVAADAVGGLLKTVVGRERPIVHGDPTRFHPFTTHGDYHSFPSGHMLHIAAIAGAVAVESRDPWARRAGDAAVLLVGWQRLHTDQHWLSDVVGGAIISEAVSRFVVQRLRAGHR